MVDSWTNDENSVLVKAYMDLVESMISGQPLVKSHVYRRVGDMIGRGPKSVEFKMLNVSGVLVSLGYGFPRGLAPAHNFQAALADTVRRELQVRPRVAAFLSSADSLQAPGATYVGSQTPPTGGSDIKDPPDGRGSAAAEVPTGRWDAQLRSVSIDDPRPAESDNFEVEDLWDFATGGGDVAAAPGHPPAALRGPRPAAVDHAMEWMEEALVGGADRRRMLFLVGGPGGGKSHVASALTRGLEPLARHDDGLAHRSYTFVSDGGTLRVINDATIPPEGSAAPASIAAEIDAAQERFVIACVNRGVLVDEAAREPAGTMGNAITSWLRNIHDDGASGPAEASHQSLRTVGEARSYVRQATVTDSSGARPTDVLAVFVDVCSLLEVQPTATVDHRGVVSAAAYEVAVFSPEFDRSVTPGGELLAAVSGSLTWRTRGDWDPIAANLQSFSSQIVRNGTLSILRSAEIASSQLFSYRELWGAMARMVAGPLPESIAKQQLGTWLDDQAAEIGEKRDPDFHQLRHLAGIRLHEALFGEDRVGRHPVLRATTVVDPARDMLPGVPGKDDLGWATPVMDAFAGAELGASPLDRLRASAGTPALAAMITPFDELLDAAYVNWVHETPDTTSRGEASAWYGRYLTRMVALAHGYPAFASEIRMWTRARSLAPALPPELESALTTLVSPRREPDDAQSKSLIPLFASRTEPLRGRAVAPTLSVVVEDVSFHTRVDGEKLLLDLTEGVQRLGAVVLDLDLIREAVASFEGWTGMTDATESTAPRLERFRSLRLIPAHRGTTDLRIAGPDGDVALSAKEQP